MLEVQDILDLEKQFGNFSYPESFLKVNELNLVDYDYWYLMDKDQILTRREGLLKRFPNRNLVPFARRGDNDDIACFEVGHGERVFIVHDYASEGWERRQEYETFWKWFLSVINELIGSE